MNNDLRNLKGKIHEKEATDIALWIIKYQKFRAKEALKNAPSVSKTAKTMRNNMNAGRRYIREGVKSNVMNKVIYDKIDELMNKHTQPLTPTALQKKRKYSRGIGKDSVLPISKLLTELRDKAQEEPDVRYGVLLDNTVTLCNNKEYAETFLNGIQFLQRTANKDISGNVVKVYIKVLEK